MNIRALAMLATAMMLELFPTPAFAQKSKKRKSERKFSEIVADSCELYSKKSFITGLFKRSESADRFERSGTSFGFGCYSGPHSKFSLGIGAELRFGNLNLKHEEDVFKASFSYFEKGFKEWVSASIYESPVRISINLGVEKTASSRFSIDSVRVNLWDTWYDFTRFGLEHLTSRGDLEVWEAGMDFRFLIYQDFHLSLGTQWQRYKVRARMDFDAESKNIFNLLYFDVSGLEQGLNESVDFFYFTPGAKWCGKKMCASFVVPYGVFISKAWSWGSALEVGIKF